MNKVVNYVKESYYELKRVQWPNRETTMRLTGMVIGVSLGVGIYIAGLDYVLNEGLAYLLSQ